jgi:hypothetical protein
MPSSQPTHHGYAVNVKDHSQYDPRTSVLEEDELQAIYSARQEDFWELAQFVAQAHGFKGVYSEGRMGGWAVPHPQPSEDSVGPGIEYVGANLAVWEHERFRPFEREILSLMSAIVEEFNDDVSEAIERAEREPAERAYWAARDVETIA